ncbi:MAG TPA: hypothetical protein VE954_32705 [Oligoflexus sp.]|uniref:hypothetical protein n=1 Tax=Oligoflexus sp. TaxID=1971216 RepID=UPI002D6CCBF7|nr:hypothetical protein [Oligoflexus sp.]HYX37890.1 hypothetical protein [Oligoflexus sp.]
MVETHQKASEPLTTKQSAVDRKREGASSAGSFSDDLEIDFEIEEQRQTPRYPLLELFVAVLDSSISGHVTQKISHRLISEYFNWTDSKVKKLIQRIAHDNWIAIHSERRGYWIRYEVHPKIVQAIEKEKPIDLKKFQKIKQKEGVMRY